MEEMISSINESGKNELLYKKKRRKKEENENISLTTFLK